MLRSVEIENFKNFSKKEYIELYQQRDSYPFSVIVGRNGGGKSCIMEAIEWVLYDGQRKDMRATAVEHMVNNSSAKKWMRVSIFLLNPTTR